MLALIVLSILIALWAVAGTARAVHRDGYGTRPTLAGYDSRHPGQ